MAVRVCNVSNHLVHTAKGAPIPQSGWADVELEDVQVLVDRRLVRVVADMDEQIEPFITPHEAAELLTLGVEADVVDMGESNIVAVPPFSPNSDDSSTIKTKRARNKRPTSAKE
jgi:hypothetical protein